MRTPIHVLFLLIFILQAAPGLASSGTLIEADSLAQEIDALVLKGDYERATNLAKNRWQSLLSETSVREWRTTDARIHHESLKTIRDLQPGKRSLLDQADSLQTVLNRCADNSHFNEGLKLAQRQLDLRVGVLGEMHPTVSESYGELIYFKYMLGEFGDLEGVLKQSLDLSRALFGEVHPTVAIDLSSFGMFLSDMGRFEEAENFLIKASDMLDELFDKDKYWEREEPYLVLNNLAVHYGYKGQVIQSTALLSELLDHETELKDDFDLDVLIRMNNLASVYRNLGSLVEAEQLYSHVIELRRLHNASNRVSLGMDLNEIASLYISMGRFSEAAELAQEAYELFSEEYGDDHLNKALSLLNLGSVALNQDAIKEAVLHYSHAVEMLGRIYGSEHWRVARALAGQGVSYLRAGDTEKALNSLKMGVNIYEKSFPDGHQKLVNCQALLARAMTHEGQFERADSLLSRATIGFEKIRLNAGEGIVRATHARSPYQDWALLKLELGEEKNAWRNIERSRGRVLADDLLGSLGEEELGGKLFENVYSLGRIQSRLQEDMAIVGWISSSNRSPRTDPLIKAWAYIIRNTGSVKWVKLMDEGGTLEAIGRANDLAERISAVPDPFRNQDHWEYLASNVFEDWIEPLMDDLEDVNDLVCILNADLYEIPLSVLPLSSSRLLGDRFNISYNFSATTTTWLKERGSETSHSGEELRALFLADPPLNARQSEEMRVAENSGSEYATRSTAVWKAEQHLRSFSVEEMPRLVGSRREVRLASQQFNIPAEVLVGPECSEQNILTLSPTISDFDIIHIATHALIDEKYPERSALILSQIDLPDPAESAKHGDRLFDGNWTVEEILSDWKLDADLVVLSGCRTARGREVTGEGQIGFAQALFQAGARGIILSLWPVDDEATALLFERFYLHLQNTGDGRVHPETSGLSGSRLSKSLKRAKQDVRDFSPDGVLKPFEAPWHWAGFILLGGSG